MSSRPRTTGRSSLITGLPPARFDATTCAGSPSTYRVEPRVNRAGSSLGPSTKNEPSRPCGRPTRPTTTGCGLLSICDLEQDAAIGPGRGRARDGTQRARDSPASPDHLPQILGGDVQAQHECAVLLELLDANRVAVGDELPC